MKNSNKKILWEKLFIKENMNDKNEILNYHFLPSNTKEDFKKYFQNSKDFDEINENNLDNETIQHLLQNNSLDMFIILILNKFISNLMLKNNITDRVLRGLEKIILNYLKT